jgi:hypothetical protein
MREQSESLTERQNRGERGAQKQKIEEQRKSKSREKLRAEKN